MNLQKRYQAAKAERKREIDNMVNQAQFFSRETYKDYRRVLNKREELPVSQKPTTAIDPFWTHRMGCVGISSNWDMEHAQLNATGLRSEPKVSVHHRPSNSYEEALLRATAL